MKSEASIEIDGPIDEVFRLTSEHVAEWSLTVVEEEMIEVVPGGVGTKFRTITEDHGQKMEFDGVVTVFEPPHRNTVHLTGKSFDIDVDYLFEKTDDGTRVTQIADVHPKGFLVAVFALIAVFNWLTRKSTCDDALVELKALKQFCESRVSDAPA